MNIKVKDERNGLPLYYYYSSTNRESPCST